MNEIQKCRENMDLKKTEIENWQEKDKIIEGEFKALVPESNQFRPILEKIYRRKIKRSKNFILQHPYITHLENLIWGMHIQVLLLIFLQD